MDELVCNINTRKEEMKRLSGTDSRPVADIISDDDKAVKELGTSHKELTEAMRSLTLKGAEGLGSPVAINEDIAVSSEESRGFLYCPFTCNHKINKRNTILYDKSEDRTIIWSDYNIHLIEEHSFYEGKGAAFRIEPQELYSLLKKAGYL